MSEHNITIEGGTSVKLKTEGKYCDRDIIVTAIKNDVQEYKGSYEVTPTFEKQTLLTARKTMRNDVIVNEIPITIVENSSGGNTVIIGG